MTVFGTVRVALMAFFQFLLYHKVSESVLDNIPTVSTVILLQIEGEYEHNSPQSSYTWTIVFLPIWILITGLGIQACRVR